MFIGHIYVVLDPYMEATTKAHRYADSGDRYTHSTTIKGALSVTSNHILMTCFTHLPGVKIQCFVFQWF